MRSLIATGIVGAGIFGALTAGAVSIAGPAAAACQTASVGFFGGGQRCDGPVDQYGNYTRCESGHGMGFGGSNCYVVNVRDAAPIPG